MSEYRTCNVCDAGATFESALDTARVRCNVRRYSDHTFTVWRCVACATLHRLEGVELSTYYNHYPFQNNEIDAWTRIAYSNYLSRLTKTGLTKSHAILDFGCGSGAFVNYLISCGYAHAYGFDEFTPGWNDPAVLSRRYDCIVAQDVIEHVEDPNKTLGEWANQLEPGGLLCIGTPNAATIDLADVEEYLLALHAPYHEHILSKQALEQIATEVAGLELLATYDRFHYDSYYPTVNYRFLRSYIRATGNMLDAAFEPPKPLTVLRSPMLWFYALFGYWFPPQSEMMLIFRRSERATRG